MKRIWLLLLMLSILCGCSEEKHKELKSVSVESLLIGGNWEGEIIGCSAVISFHKNGDFSNHCGCGSSVGNADLAESYHYNAETNELIIYESDKKPLESGKIVYIDEYYLVVDLWDETIVYENLDSTRFEMSYPLWDEYDHGEHSKPFVTVLNFDHEKLSVSSYEYDKDAADPYTIWELPIADEVKFLFYSVIIENDKKSIDAEVLTMDECTDFAGSTAYLVFNANGEVTEVIFYGEMIIDI